MSGDRFERSFTQILKKRAQEIFSADAAAPSYTAFAYPAPYPPPSHRARKVSTYTRS